jgi:cytochrome c peroxidase
VFAVSHGKLLALITGLSIVMPVAVPARDLTPLEELGKLLFFDADLSTPPGQSCAACHAPEVGFTGPVSSINEGPVVYPGAIHARFGNRKPPSSAYGGESPVFYYDSAEDLFIGGMFWDGRATGWTLGDPLAEQAQGPFLNPLEQNNPSARSVCLKVALSAYADLFEEVWGPGSLDYKHDVAGTYERIARSIAAYERSDEVNPFSSKFDYYLRGEAELTEEEEWGLELFEGEAMCSACHPSEPGPGGEPPLFTDFTYDNLGVPRNPENPFYNMPPEWTPDGDEWTDPGLGGFLAGTSDFASYAAVNWGKHKVPTLRNVDKRPDSGFVKAFTHNGYFKTLEELVHFYNTRDVEEWPDPEVPENVNHEELGDLGLTEAEELAVVAFTRTLSDGYTPEKRMARGVNPAVEMGVSGPNPFNPTAMLSYTLAEAGPVRLQVFDIQGRRVATLVDGWRAAGHHQALFAADDLSSGVYFARLTSGPRTAITKILLLK